MAYQKTNWQTRDIISKDRLDKIEQELYDLDSGAITTEIGDDVNTLKTDVAALKTTVDGTTTVDGLSKKVSDLDTAVDAVQEHFADTGKFTTGTGTASANYATATGENTTASGEASTAEGINTIANHRSQTVSGEYNIADPSDAAATARGTYIEIVGNGDSNTRSNARTLDWQGNETLAGELVLKAGTNDQIRVSEAIAAIAEATGASASTHFPDTGKLVAGTGTASADYAAVVGNNTTASGVAATASGDSTTASGSTSSAQGFSTIANHKSQHVFGEYNVADTSEAEATARGTYVEIVGNGTMVEETVTRSNARTLDWNGNEVLMGELTVNNGTENPIQVGAAITNILAGAAATVSVEDGGEGLVITF